MFDHKHSGPGGLLDVNLIRLDFPVLRREVHGRRLVYLDSAATSQKPQIMIDRMVEIYGHKYARVEEGHSLSRGATKAFEGVRAQVASLINATAPQEIIFCRGATEALNLVSRISSTRACGKATRPCSLRPSTIPTSCPGCLWPGKRGPASGWCH